MKTKPIHLRLPADLIEMIKQGADATSLTEQEVMRLAMRIGLIALRASKDIAGIMQQVATDKGESFLSWAREKQSPALQKIPRQIPTVQNVAGTSATQSTQPAKAATARTVPLRTHIMTESELKVAEEVTPYKSTARAKTGTED